MRRIVFILAWIAAAALLLRFGRDFTASFWPVGDARRALIFAFWALVAATLGVSAANVFRPRKENPLSAPAVTILRATVPAAFLASSLGCSGLAVAGCSGICTVLRWVGVPVLAVAALLSFSGRRVPPHGVLALAAIALLPHCICENPANAWWVAQVGASPMCYAWAFAAALVAFSTESAGGRPLPALLVNGAIVGGSLAFFAGHHFVGYPW
ncbi:MAG: hypothetical protein ABR576_02755 [Thermoanaerobaculia bacterium]